MKYIPLLLLVACCGCEPPAVTAPPFEPVKAAELAMQEYDTNGDGKIDKTEAKKTVMDPKKGWDNDGDGSITAEEIQARLERYEQLKAGIQTIACTVKWRGDYLPNAEVLFEPEAFLGESIVPAEGTTDGYGQAEIIAPSIAAEDPTLQGMREGLYRVRITHPDVKIPKRYNEETTLFFELSPMDNTLMPTFNLR